MALNAPPSLDPKPLDLRPQSLTEPLRAEERGSQKKDLNWALEYHTFIPFFLKEPL